VLVSQDQHFTCAQCGRCCRRTTVPVTAGEAKAYRSAGAVRWFSDERGSQAAELDPFEAIPGHAPLLRIRKRADGGCGFLSPEGLCRIHQEMGADRKPIACQVFPFSFHPSDADVTVSASFACPTIVANDGVPLRSQVRELRVLHSAWMREYPETPAQIELVAGHALPRPALTALRGFLTKIVDRSGPGGRPDLRGNLRRIAAFLDDLSRPRVTRLQPDDFVEYLNVMGRHAVTNTKLAPSRRASRVTRLLFRGFLLAAVSVQERLDVPQENRFAFRLRLLHLLAHLHGVAPATKRFDLRRAGAMPLPLDDDGIHQIAHRYLHASFETVGTGRRPLLDEVAMIVARLNAACVLAGMHAAASHKPAIDGVSFTQGLLEAADLAQADDGGTLSRYVTTLSGGIDALYLFPPMTA
jgi:Fe-S-cluster containining protein